MGAEQLRAKKKAKKKNPTCPSLSILLLLVLLRRLLPLSHSHFTKPWPCSPGPTSPRRSLAVAASSPRACWRISKEMERQRRARKRKKREKRHRAGVTGKACSRDSLLLSLLLSFSLFSPLHSSFLSFHSLSAWITSYFPQLRGEIETRGGGRVPKERGRVRLCRRRFVGDAVFQSPF